jgi:hypothetical protein
VRRSGHAPTEAQQSLDDPKQSLTVHRRSDSLTRRLKHDVPITTGELCAAAFTGSIGCKAKMRSRVSDACHARHFLLHR